MHKDLMEMRSNIGKLTGAVREVSSDVNDLETRLGELEDEDSNLYTAVRSSVLTCIRDKTTRDLVLEQLPAKDNK